jgi:Tol biopolymer transport system component
MAELHDRFHSLDRIAVPDLWAEVEERAFARVPRPLKRVGVRFGQDLPELPRSRLARLALVLAALILIVLAIALAASSRDRFTSPLVFTTSAGVGGEAIYVLDRAGAEPQAIFEGNAGDIQVSPDGQYVLFHGGGPGPTLARTDGSNSRTFTEGAWTAAWAPDSHAVAWITGQGNQATLMIDPVDGGKSRHLPLPGRVEPHLAWSPDNVHLAYTGCEPWDSMEPCQAIARLLIVDTTSGEVSEFGPLYPAKPPVWSHDGRHLAAAVWPEGVDPEPGAVVRLALVSLGTDTGDISTVNTGFEVSSQPPYAISFGWSADDRGILILVPATTGGLDVLSVPVDGGALERRGHLGEGWPVSSFIHRGPAWSPGGSQPAWTEVDDGSTETYSLWVMDLADGQLRRVAGDVLGYANSVVTPLWSSDGAWIAFYRKPSSPTYKYEWPYIQRVGGEGSIWIVRPDGSGERLVVDDSFGVDVGRADW